MGWRLLSIELEWRGFKSVFCELVNTGFSSPFKFYDGATLSSSSSSSSEQQAHLKQEKNQTSHTAAWFLPKFWWVIRTSMKLNHTKFEQKLNIGGILVPAQEKTLFCCFVIGGYKTNPGHKAEASTVTIWWMSCGVNPPPSLLPRLAPLPPPPLERTWPTARTVAFLCVDPTQSTETGKVCGLCWHNQSRERKGK